MGGLKPLANEKLVRFGQSQDKEIDDGRKRRTSRRKEKQEKVEKQMREKKTEEKR